MEKKDLSEYSLVEVTESITRNFTKNKLVWFRWISKRPKIFSLSTFDGKSNLELKKKYLNKIKRVH